MKIIRKVRSKLLLLGVFAVAMLAVLFMWQRHAMQAYASLDMAWGEEKRIHSAATIDDDFADDKVIVVLNRQETLNFRSWTVNDFPELNLVSVEDLTASSGEIVNADINRRQFGETSQTISVRALDSTQINADEFRTILRLTLEEPGKENVLGAIEQLEHRRDIVSAEPDFAIYIISSTPDDPFYISGDQWGLNGANGISAPQAWGITTGSNTVMVGVVDTGIQANHPDLAGRVNIALSRDFTFPAPHIPTSVEDTNGHGTHVAGIIGAQGNNGIGISGVGQNIQLVSLKITATSLAFGSDLVMLLLMREQMMYLLSTIATDYPLWCRQQSSFPLRYFVP